MAVATEQQQSTYQEMTDEQKAIVEMVRDFVDNEIIPVAEEYDDDPSAEAEPWGFVLAVYPMVTTPPTEPTDD